MVEAVMALYVNSGTRVKTISGISEEFNILLGVYQGCVVLSPLLFIIVMDELTKEIYSWEWCLRMI